MKYISILAFSLLVVCSQKGLAQVVNYADKLPVDKTVKKGVLPNGMTYYIKSTSVVKNAASYYIIQNVGSILENDDQQGLAHFLEHMAFNGTENFKGKGILNTLQKHGAVFGKDINAYTSFDETVYNLNYIPTNDGLVDTGLLVLHDWSHYLLLTDEEIDSERGVIKEEWRTRQNGQTRLYEGSLPIVYNNSKYTNRTPIGLMSIVEGFDHKALRDFYHDWYRTDLQAIAVIGDVNVEEIEQKIIKEFSNIPAVKNPKERFVVNVPDNNELLYHMGKDPEVSTAYVSFGIRHKKSLEPQTVADLKQELLESMTISMLSGRISEQAQKPDASYLGVRTTYGTLSRTSNTFSLSIAPKGNQQKEAFKSVLTQVVSAVKFGFLQSEIDRQVAQFKSAYENQIAKKDGISHEQIESSIQGNYLENKTITDIEEEYKIAKKIFASITPEDLHQTIKRLYAKNNRYLNVIGVEGQDNLTEQQAKQIISDVENDSNIARYTEELEGKTLVSSLNIKGGKITKEIKNATLGSTTFVLGNGIKVYYKFANKDKDNVTLSAISYGGTSLLKDNDLPSANLLGDLIGLSGLGDFSAVDLSKILAGKTAKVSIGLSKINESLSGSSNTKDVETMLQLVHLYFVKPRFDKEAFKVLNSNISNYITRRSQDIGEKMKDSLNVALYGKNNPKARIFNQDYANEISFEKIKSIYKDRFSDPSDFEFFIVGDVKERDLKPLLEKYLASIPTKGIKEKYKDNGAQWISKHIDKDIYMEMKDAKSTVNITYKKEMPYSMKESIYARALGDILQLRVTETVREEQGGAYSPSASAVFYREPKSIVYVSFSFDCNPDLADKLAEITKKEFQKIADGNIQDEDLNKIKTNFLKERQQLKDRNSFDMQLLTNYFKYNTNIDDPKNFEDIINSMTKKDIQDLSKEILKDVDSYKVMFKPLVNKKEKTM